MDESSGQPPAARGAAWRRRQLRLRSMLGHEQQTVRMLLATMQHHSASRGQKIARTGKKGYEKKYTVNLRSTHTPTRQKKSDFEQPRKENEKTNKGKVKRKG